jgi:hypothetical protein
MTSHQVGCTLCNCSDIVSIFSPSPLSNEPDYDEDEYQLENEQQEESREIATTNQVF